MKKSAKGILSLILVLTMVMSVCVLPAMAYEVEGDNGLYVYVGDSMTFDFVGSHNQFLNSCNIYGWQAARAMGYATDDYGKFPGGRSTDVYAALADDYDGDDYTIQKMKSYSFGKPAERFKQAVIDAKAISLQLGYSELTTFLLEDISQYLENGKLRFSCDLNQVFSQEELEKVMPFVNKSMKLIDAVIPDSTEAAFSQFMAQLSDAEKDAVIGLLGQETFDKLNDITATVDALKDVFVYTLVSALVHFDATVAEIYKLNPDVELYVMGIANPMAQISAGFNLNGVEFSLPVGELMASFFAIVNSYYRVFSPYSDQYYFIPLMHHFETYGEAIANDEELARQILYALYNGDRSGYETQANAAAYAKADAQAAGFSQMAKNTTMIDIGKLIADLVNGASIDTSEAVFEKLASYDENGITTASYADQVGALVAAVGIMKGIYVHPTQAAHDAEAPLLIAAMQNPQVDPLAIAYHKMAAPMEQTVKALNECSTIDEFTAWVESIKDIWKEDAPVVDDVDDADDDSGDEADVPAAPQPTVLEKIGTVVKNVVKTVSTTVNAVFAKLGSLFR